MTPSRNVVAVTDEAVDDAISAYFGDYFEIQRVVYGGDTRVDPEVQQCMRAALEAAYPSMVAEVERLREALKPFAEIDEPGEFFSDSENLNVTITLYGGNELVLTLDNLTVGQLRKARATLTDTAGER